MAESLERTLIAQVDRFVEGRAHELAGARQPLQTLLVGVEDVDAGDELADGRGGAGSRPASSSSRSRARTRSRCSRKSSLDSSAALQPIRTVRQLGSSRASFNGTLTVNTVERNSIPETE